ncbi:variant erythrocyte surface antigen-1 family protein, partial [Babesia divergens]
MARLVCYMYYTDVFVGSNDIDKLKDALNAELKGSVLNDALTQLVQGLCLFMGYPSCVCKPKKSVGESLKKISKELKEELKNYECSSITISNSDLNCNSCSDSHVVCKCCVLDCISKVQTSCLCVKGSNKNCSCSSVEPKRCCKDLLEKLKASLSLLNLKADMENLCQCNDDCCVDGVCTQKGSSNCNHCKTLQTPKDYTVTGLGLLRPSPIRLAERLDKIFGTGGKSKGSCSCQCGSTDKSCCCLACDTQKCAQACSCNGSGSCPHGSQPQPQPSPCPCKEFCSKINSIKVLEKSSDMTCCQEGAKCHCELQGSPNKCTPSSGQKCCVVDDKSGSGRNFQQGVKCMIRRLVRFFKDLPLDSSVSSSQNCSKLCCELICVGKYCEFLRDFYNKGGQKSCGTCNPGTKGKCPGSTLQSPASSNNCCGGDPSTCSTSNCCLGCQECDAIKFRNALEGLKYSSPCGQELYRVLDNFLYYCFNVFMGHKDFIRNTLLKAVKGCPSCNKTGQNSSGWKACECSSSSSGSCTACPKLLGNSKLMSVLLSQYSSSYDSSSAKWESLCPTTPKPSSTCCCGQPSCSCSKSSLNSCCKSSSVSSCDPSKCCDACPQRKAAKIFLGMLPCLYYGLKILYDRSKYDSGFAGWHDISVNSDGKPESALGKFLYAWGFQTIESSGSSTIHLDPLLQAMVLPVLLENLFTPKSSVNFKNLYENCKIYFTSFSSRSISNSDSPSNPPTTVREILLWLYGLRFHKHFSELVENCKSLCSPFGNSFNSDAFCYYIHTCSFILPISIISFIEDSSSALSLLSSSSDWKDFSYPEDPFKLFETFCDFVRKIYIPLHFLRFQCSLDKDKAGWQNCYFGKNCQTTGTSSPSPSGCSCQGSDKYLCTKDHSGCSGSSSSCTAKCPHPLQAFLIDGSSVPPSKDYPFGLPGITPMGFESSNLSSTAKSGYDLYAVLHVFCESGFYPLTRLVEFALCIFRYPPETLGEFFAFFKRFAESDVFKNFGDYVDGEPGFYSGSDLKTALENLFKHNSHSNDLKSLYDCPGQKGSSGSPPTCGKYLYSLTYNAYNNKNFIEGFLDTYLSWICYRAEKFYSDFKDFHKASTKSLKCCSASCKIVECPCALPRLYAQGFTFVSPGDLNCVTSSGTSKHVSPGQGGKDHGKHSPGDEKCTTKSCSDFVAQLEKVAGKDSPLQTLLTVIDNFIWSIRLPFFFGFLYVWFFVLSYFCYVILIKLDT